MHSRAYLKHQGCPALTVVVDDSWVVDDLGFLGLVLVQANLRLTCYYRASCAQAVEVEDGIEVEQELGPREAPSCRRVSLAVAFDGAGQDIEEKTVAEKEGAWDAEERTLEEGSDVLVVL